MITAEQFEKATGQKPENDDLDRANCPLAGQIGHQCCGWCEEHGVPKFMCHCWVKELPAGQKAEPYEMSNELSDILSRTLYWELDDIAEKFMGFPISPKTIVEMESKLNACVQAYRMNDPQFVVDFEIYVKIGDDNTAEIRRRRKK